MMFTTPFRNHLTILFSLSMIQGTSYTISNTKEVTQLAVGTNYADEVRPGFCCQRLPLPDNTSGPYIINPFHDLPATNLLTKTHCKVESWSPSDFELGCRTLDMPRSDGFEIPNRTSYNASSIRRAVHLTRHPLDNLVARKHLIVRHHYKWGKLSDDDYSRFNDTAEGFQAWCQYYDAIQIEKFPPIVIEAMRLNETNDIPCVTDLILYVKWHSWAIHVTEQYGMDVHYLYYEDYMYNYNETIRALYNFLELPMVHDPLPFDSSKTYHHYYTQKQRTAVMDFVQTWATTKAMQVLDRYFDDKE